MDITKKNEELRVGTWEEGMITLSSENSVYILVEQILCIFKVIFITSIYE